MPIHHPTLRLATALTAVLMLALAGANKAFAFVIAPGVDLFATAASPPSFFDLPLPGGGTVTVPLTANPIGPANTDTKVQRLNGATLDNDGDTASINIEMVALSLQSASPVDIMGTLFDVDIVSGTGLGQPPNPQGIMVVTRTSPSGGIIDLLSLPIDFLVTLTEVGNPGNTQTSPGNVVFGPSQSVFSINPGPGDVHDASNPSGGFYAGVDPETGEKRIWAHTVPGEAHHIEPAMDMMPPPPNGAPEPVTVLLVGMGLTGIALGRRRRTG